MKQYQVIFPLASCTNFRPFYGNYGKFFESSPVPHVIAVAYAGKNFGGGVQGRGTGLVICKKFLQKIAKNAVFSPILQKNFKTMR